MGIDLNKGQVFGLYKIEDWWRSSNNQVINVAGGAGTGKTFFIRYFIDYIGLSLDDVLFVAYMGKAVSQLQRNGLPAKTIHSAIYKYERVLAKDENGKFILNAKGKPVLKGQFVLRDKIKGKPKLIVVDEAGMVNEQQAKDLLSFGIPIIALGDLNQLPPVFGKSYFLRDPEIIFSEIMRQEEGSPIIYLANQILAGKPLKIGVYGTCSVINAKDITEYNFKSANIVLTETNRLRYNVNNYYREKLKGYKNLDKLYVGEKVICRKNNWNKVIDDNIYLTNGTTGFIDYVYRDSCNGKTIKLDFCPDFSPHPYTGLTCDYKHFFEDPSGVVLTPENEVPDFTAMYSDRMEFAYGITVHSSQGSQWDNVLYLSENTGYMSEDRKKIMYTAVTRAAKGITVVLK